jgi:hypothetical protein
MKVRFSNHLMIVFASVGAIASSFLTGCSDECSVGKTKCVNDAIIRYCIKDKDDNPKWVEYACGEGTVCASVEEVSEGAADAGSKTSDAGSKSDASSVSAALTNADSDSSGEMVDMCTGVCEEGAFECINAEMSRYCVDGTTWFPNRCSVGESCDSGSGKCKVSSTEQVKACTPGATACVSKEWEKTCDADGSDWRLEACKPWETCTETDKKCVADPDKACLTEGDGNAYGWCQDDKTSVRCDTITGGYKVVPCAGQTYCAEGICRGPVCNLGSSCTPPISQSVALPSMPTGTAPAERIYECVDGVNMVYSECGGGEICWQNVDKAECVKPACKVGQAVCGNPKDNTVDKTKFFSVCKRGTGDYSDLPEWQVVECKGNLVCDPTVSGQDLCQAECSPGAQLCVTNKATGIVDGWTDCGEKGTWGSIQDCNPKNEAKKVCMNKLNQEAGAINKITCADPICSALGDADYLQDRTHRVEGVCGGTNGIQIRTCDADGHLQSAASDCPKGICRNMTSSLDLTDDGHYPGYCDTDVECTKDEEQCVNSGLDSLYRTCVDGKWSTAISRCSDDKKCLGFTDAQGLEHKLCGGDCSPGKTRCDPSDTVKLQRCKSDGTWGSSEACALGVCDPDTATNPQCVVQCEPGRVYCDTINTMMKTASDGISDGYSGTRTCRSDGRWPSHSNGNDSNLFGTCEGTAACRISGTGIHTGCIECLGPKVPGGNEDGVADTTCEDTKYKACGADNKWQSATDCGSGKTCVPPPQFNTSICDMCTSGSGNEVYCTPSAVNDTESCGTCELAPAPEASGGTGPQGICTQNNIAAASFCDNCLAGDDTSVVCTNANLLAHVGCSTCTMPDNTTQTCTQTNIAAHVGATTNNTCALAGYGTVHTSGCCTNHLLRNGCSSAGFGSTYNWNSNEGCCSEYIRGSQYCSGTNPGGNTFNYYGSVITRAGGALNCCSSRVVGTQTTCSSLGLDNNGSCCGDMTVTPRAASCR